MNNKYEENPNSAKYRLIPIILMMGLVPLIVHMYQYNTNLSQFDWFPDNSETIFDFFFAWKMYAIILVGGFIGLTLLYRHFIAEDKFRFEKPFAFLLVYLVLVLLAAVFSKYKYWVAHGTYELFEPVWVIIAYLLLCYYTYNYVREEKQVDYILGWSGIGMAVVTLLGVFQYAGLDFFKTVFGKKLILNPAYWDQMDSITFKLKDKTSYTTLYNPNFLSFYFGMLIPLLLCLLIGAKKVWQKVLLAVAEVLCIICMKGSGSDSGWMALIIGAVILMLVLLSRKKRTMILGCVLLVASIIGGVVFMSQTSVGQRVKNTVVGTYYMKDKFALNDIEIGDDAVTLDIRGEKLALTFELMDDDAVQAICKDANGKELEQVASDKEEQIYKINDNRFDEIQIQPFAIGDDEKFACLSATIDDVEWLFLNAGGDDYYYLNSAGKPVKCESMKQPEVFFDDAMSSRGHIWNQTIPLLKKHILIGCGANAYMLEYPQNDYIGQEYIYKNGYQVKAHCWYLQQWVENGLVATLALLAFLGWYVIRSIRIYRRVDLHQRLSWIGFGLFSAVLVYLIAAVVNDSNVCTAPVFWGMLGLGLAVNRMLVEKEKLFQKAEEDTEVKKRVF